MIPRYGGHAEKDTTAAIWEMLYLVRIPYLATMSVDYIKEFGLPTSGDPDIDKEQANQYVTTYLSIAKLVDYHKEGVPIRIVNKKDVEDIYLAINEHLEAWKLQIRNGINIGDAPIEDLIAMDAFANDVYGHAKYGLKPEETMSAFVAAFSKFNGFAGHNLFKGSSLPSSVSNDPNVVRINHTAEDEIPERESLTEMFKQSLVRTSRFKNRD